MKTIITSICLGMTILGYSQVIIGGHTGTAPSNKKDAVLLEFEAGQNKGIILPYVRTIPTAVNTTPGTMLLDASTATMTSVKYYAPGNAKADANGWIDLSNGNKANLITPTDYMIKQPSALIEDTTSKAIIGANTTSAKGVLVLESTTKAMLLPQVLTTDDVKDPAPGMMVYVNGTKKRLAVFNGAKWTFWAP